MEKINFNQLNFEQIGSWPLILRIFLSILILILSCVAGYYLSAAKSYTNLDEAKQRLIDLKKQYKSDYAIAVNLDTYKQQLLQIGKSLDNQLKEIPTNNNIAELLNSIAYYANDCDLEIKFIKPGKTDSVDFYTTYDFTITFNGTYHALGKFAESLTMLPRLVTVNSFKINLPNSANNQFQAIAKEPKLNAEINLKTFWIVDQPGPIIVDKNNV